MLDDVAHALRPHGAVMSQYRRLQHLVSHIPQLGIDILFRVQDTTRFHNSEGDDIALKDLGIQGFVWQAAGAVFKAEIYR